MSMMKRAAVAFGVLLSLGVAGVAALVGYVNVKGAANLQYPDTSYPAIRASSDPEVIERGRYLVHGPAHCDVCHGAGVDKEHPAALLDPALPLSGGQAIRPPFGTFYASNLTPDPETGIGAWTDEEIARTVRTGVRRSGELSVFMRLAVGDVSDEDLIAIVSYLWSRPPVRNAVPPSEPNLMALGLVAFSPILPKGIEGSAHVPPADEPSIERGRYLANGPAVCAGCHSPEHPERMFEHDPTRLFAGGAPHPSELDGTQEFCPPNLTTDPETGTLAHLSEAAFVARMRAGRAHQASIMPWESYGRMTDADLRSIYRYLVSLPPQKNDVGPSFREAGWSP